jgi:hypothetical protein
MQREVLEKPDTTTVWQYSHTTEYYDISRWISMEKPEPCLKSQCLKIVQKGCLAFCLVNIMKCLKLEWP